ncbi:MAG: hypothetical protein M0P94_02455 [Candidatus Absconditabacterales bacterium]|nr:hypothetical protein [Candidatus Absconditabacterales bacterium]
MRGHKSNNKKRNDNIPFLKDKSLNTLSLTKEKSTKSITNDNSFNPLFIFKNKAIFHIFSIVLQI